nr:hypothetical protein Itr_chr10CG21100 [Ipomoea trifida]
MAGPPPSNGGPEDFAKLENKAEAQQEAIEALDEDKSRKTDQTESGKKDQTSEQKQQGMKECTEAVCEKAAKNIPSAKVGFNEKNGEAKEAGNQEAARKKIINEKGGNGNKFGKKMAGPPPSNGGPEDFAKLENKAEAQQEAIEALDEDKSRKTDQTESGKKDQTSEQKECTEAVCEKAAKNIPSAKVGFNEKNGEAKEAGNQEAARKKIINEKGGNGNKFEQILKSSELRSWVTKLVAQ